MAALGMSAESMERLILAAEEAAREGDIPRLEAMQRIIAMAADSLRAQQAVEQQMQRSTDVSSLQSQALAHRSRLEFMRFGVAILLIVALFSVIFAGVAEGIAGDSVAQFAAPVSGLAGIAIGWLFSGRDQGSSIVDTLPALEQQVAETPQAQPSIYIGGSNFGGRVGDERDTRTEEIR
ncbi:hypothetical protein ACQRWP_21960 [Micromonospora trifolii]|uniref:hypothetical protein n=1 Tax=Micromonospora trifolii TaxID=2911208 RepID=UPI003D2EC924